MSVRTRQEVGRERCVGEEEESLRGPGRAAPPSAAATDNMSCRGEAVWFQLIKQKVPSLCWDPHITHILSHLYFSSQTVEEQPHTVHYPQKAALCRPPERPYTIQQVCALCDVTKGRFYRTVAL